MVKAARTAATYCKDNSRIEGVPAIANEIARGPQPAVALIARTNKSSPQRTKKAQRSLTRSQRIWFQRGE
jgi:hypothetical protein